MEYRYQPEGVCSYEMIFEIDGDVVKSLKDNWRLSRKYSRCSKTD